MALDTIDEIVKDQYSHFGNPQRMHKNNKPQLVIEIARE